MPHLIIDQPVCGIGVACFGYALHKQKHTKLWMSKLTFWYYCLNILTLIYFCSFIWSSGVKTATELKAELHVNEITFPYLLEIGLAKNRCRMKVDLFLPATGKQGSLLVDINKVWIHASHQGCLHYGPVLRVQIHITNIIAPTGPNKTWRTNRLFQILVVIHFYINSIKQYLN